MPDSHADLQDGRQLRLTAELRLKKGTAPASRGGALSADALGVLFKLASNPANASEGLKLLHELQTHQVELDLQHEQLETNEREFVQELAHYKALYDFAPCAYFIADPDGNIIESNQAGAQLFGLERDELGGCPLAGFLSPESRPLLAALLKKLRAGAAHASCPVQSCASEAGSGPSRWQIAANRSPEGETVLMMVSAGELLPGA
ncbi:MAG: PAS domain S-box protein [bacterium]|nr:PAS domain S-box protein [bacterium]